MRDAQQVGRAGGLGFFAAIATSGSLSVAARELGITTPAVSKRLSQIETRLGVPLLNRTTRRMSLPPEGEVFLEHARRFLGDIDDLNQLLTTAKGSPKGLLRVNATLGFGRLHMAPLISRYVARYPDVDVQFQLSVSPPALTDDQFDVCVRFGEPCDVRVITRRLAPNRRLLCASPKYLAARGEPKVPADLRQHNCISIRQGDDAYGTWRPAAVRGPALDGHGILLRAEWDIIRHLKSGRLIQVLPQYRAPDADIYAVYLRRHQLSTRIRTFVDFLAQAFEGFESRIA